MKGVGGILVAVLALLATACGNVPGTGGTTPTPSGSASPADPVAAAWHKCGASRVPPSVVLNAQVPASTRVLWHDDVTQSDVQDVLKAYGRTEAMVSWAITNNEIRFLQGPCIAAPLSHTEDDDIQVAQMAKAAGGHAVLMPEPMPVRLGIQHAPPSVADAIQSRISIRPSYAVVAVVPGAVAWVVDAKGNRIRKLGESDPGKLYATVMFGSTRHDGIGSRYWQFWQYTCSDPEVAGVCDGVV